MTEYEFTLRFKVPAESADHETLAGRLADAGCDDASVGIGQPGRIALIFGREASSAKEAITSAIAAVKRAVPGASLIEVAPDFVGISDVGTIVGVTRQAIRKIVLAHQATFPPPLHEGSSSLWHLAHVLDWMRERGNYEIEDSLYEIATAAMQVNLARESESISPKTRSELRALLR